MSPSNEEYRQKYVAWRRDRNTTRIRAIEMYGQVTMDLSFAGYVEDSMIMLEAMQAVFPELTEELVKGVITEVSKDQPERPTEKLDIRLS